MTVKVNEVDLSSAEEDAAMKMFDMALQDMRKVYHEMTEELEGSEELEGARDKCQRLQLKVDRLRAVESENVTLRAELEGDDGPVLWRFHKDRKAQRVPEQEEQRAGYSEQDPIFSHHWIDHGARTGIDFSGSRIDSTARGGRRTGLDFGGSCIDSTVRGGRWRVQSAC